MVDTKKQKSQKPKPSSTKAIDDVNKYFKNKKNIYRICGAVLVLLLVSVLIFFAISSEEKGEEVQDIDETEKLELSVPKKQQIEADLFIVRDEVTITRNGEVLKNTAENVTVYEGDVIKTNETGIGYILFADNSVLAIDKNSEIELNVYQRSVGGYKINIKQNFGNIWSKVKKLIGNDSKYSIETSNTLASVRGTEFGCQTQPGTTICQTDSGEILLELKNVRDDLSEYLLTEGKMFENDDEKLRLINSLEELTQFVSEYDPLDSDWQKFIDCLKETEDLANYQDCSEQLVQAIEKEIGRIQEVIDGGTSGESGASTYCGNNVLDSSEICDDGNNIDGDGCSADCSSNETCGNGLVDLVQGEECDPPRSGVCDDKCREVQPTCSNPIDPVGGSYQSCSDVADGDTCTLTCNTGYQKTGDASCNRGNWQYPSDPQCDPICDGAQTCARNATCISPGNCQCNDGYGPSPDAYTTCKPVCNPSCATNATCVAPDTCQCNSGYTGDPNTLCEPVCDPVCGMNASCNAPNTCECDTGSGYTGDPYTICEGVCLIPSCGTNALCVAHDVCQCPEGYVGDPLVACTPVCDTPCVANATCVSPNNCQCNNGYTGDGEIGCTAVCNSPPCGTNAICSGPNVCQCPTGFGGDPYLACDPVCTVPCGTNAGCIAPETCACDPGYEGDPYSLCDPACHSSPCVPNAECVGPEICQCLSGFIGDGHTICEPDCSSLPCGINALCIAPGICECEPGFAGDPYIVCDPASTRVDAFLPKASSSIRESVKTLVAVILLVIFILFFSFVIFRKSKK